MDADTTTLVFALGLSTLLAIAAVAMSTGDDTDGHSNV